MQNQKSRLAIIHLAKKQLNLDEEAYRAILYGAGVESAKDIETDLQFNTVMGAFERLGFKSTGWAGRRMNTVSGSPGMISRRQEYYIKGLWALASRAKDERSLRRMIKRIGKVDDISFLYRQDARAIILALRDICWKAGFNPDNKEGVFAYNGKKSGGDAANRNSGGILHAEDGGDRSCEVQESHPYRSGRIKRI
jgi:hypothetical protein